MKTGWQKHKRQEVAINIIDEHWTQIWENLAENNKNARAERSVSNASTVYMEPTDELRTTKNMNQFENGKS